MPEHLGVTYAVRRIARQHHETYYDVVVGDAVIGSTYRGRWGWTYSVGGVSAGVFNGQATRTEAVEKMVQDWLDQKRRAVVP